MINIGSFAHLSYEQFSIAVLLIVLATLVVTFIIPILTRSEALRFNSSYLVKKIKDHKAWSVGVAIVIILAILGGYYWYQTTKPIVITATAFKQKEAKALDFTLKSSQYDIITKGDLLMIDARSEKEFLAAHTQNSFNVPVDNFKQNRVLLQIKGKKVAVFANRADFSQALTVASYIKGKLTKQKVYVIKDGYENVKTIGLPLVRGDQYESVPIK